MTELTIEPLDTTTWDALGSRAEKHSGLSNRLWCARCPQADQR